MTAVSRSVLSATCTPDCGANGFCVDVNECSCLSGWTGNDCSQCVKLPGCNNGDCSVGNDCECTTAQWTGSLCQIPVCSPDCVNGECTSPDTCTCALGWQGSDCSECIKGADCPDDFHCVNPGDCIGDAVFSEWVVTHQCEALDSSTCATGGATVDGIATEERNCTNGVEDTCAGAWLYRTVDCVLPSC